MNNDLIKRINTVVEEDIMTPEKWETLWRATKEPLRLLALAIIAWALTEIAALENQETWMIYLTFVLRFADKWLHEFGKRTQNDQLAKGITRF